MDLFDDAAPTVVPGRRLTARLVALLVGDGAGFETRPVREIAFRLDGIVGDGHAGFTRRAGGREPWYPRGAEIRSGRQVSVVSDEELSAVAGRLGLSAVDPAVIGANVVLSGVPQLSFLPAGTRMFFPGGATLVVEAKNAPCRLAGKALAERMDRADLEFAFVEAAKRRRGIVASVERAGDASLDGGEVTLRVPEQWIYAAPRGKGAVA